MNNTETAPAPSKPPKPPSLNEMIAELAGALRDSIVETPEGAVEQNPEDAYTDLACRLIIRLQNTLAIVPAVSGMAQTEAQIQYAEAAERTMAILTRWLRKDPGGRFYTTEVGGNGNIRIVTHTSRGTELLSGDSVQDAYAQFAQTLMLDEEGRA